MVGGTKPGKHNVRNRQRREKRRVLIAEAKVSLVRIKELEAQLKLEEEQKSELHDPQQVKKLETQLGFVQEDKERLEHKLQKQEQYSEQHGRKLLGLIRREEREVEKKRAELKELEEKHSEEIMEKYYEALDQQGALERKRMVRIITQRNKSFVGSEKKYASLGH